ncbi:hypothetical protein GJV85_03540 [Sulfurimonas aquatica]|uniref:Uncharacterized protein n=1 Tax=Sulfurimonas aquatica TaxID=2672570 RepID=A0A975AZ86_9BACT|nr:hypothetical protein [Sulfurimonas aquatica]QSZ41223.1 hypothetical protein GJV85_03540 [Sulfurimonas aquatica]
MQTYNEADDTTETYSYQGTEVIIITVFKTGINSVAIVEDVSTGEQFEVFRDQLY